MRHIRFTRFTTVSSGKVKLTESQARRHRKSIKHIDGNLYQIVKPTGFKAGTEIRYDGQLPKTAFEDISAPYEVRPKEDYDGIGQNPEKVTASEPEAPAKKGRKRRGE